MEHFYQSSYFLAQSIYEFATINEKQEVYMTLLNSIKDEILIKSCWNWNGMNCNVQIFSDGLLINENTMEGGSFEILESFLIKTLDIQNHTGHKNDIFNGDSSSHSTNSNILTFSEFVEDKKIENILAAEPEIAFHEKKVP
jgi:hypothetical protein